MNNKIQQLTFNRDSYSDVLEVTDELAALEQRKPHDSIRLLILEAGRAKINKIRSERAKELGIPAVQEQAAPVVENLSSVNGKEQDT